MAPKAIMIGRYTTWLTGRFATELVVPGGFEPPSEAPKAPMIGRYTKGLQYRLISL